MLDKLKGMGLSALGALVELEPSQEQSAPQQMPSAQQSTTFQASAPAGVTSSISTVSLQPAVDQEMYQLLQKTITNRQTAYTALLDASEKMRSVIVDDVVRIKAAYLASSGGRSIVDVQKAIDVHVSDLAGEKGRFSHSLNQQLGVRCAVPRQQAGELNAQAEQLKLRIDQLQSEIVACQGQITQAMSQADELLRSATQAEQEVQSVNDKFVKAVDYATNELLDRKVQLSKILS